MINSRTEKVFFCGKNDSSVLCERGQHGRCGPFHGHRLRSLDDQQRDLQRNADPGVRAGFRRETYPAVSRKKSPSGALGLAVDRKASGVSPGEYVDSGGICIYNRNTKDPVTFGDLSSVDALFRYELKFDLNPCFSTSRCRP